MTQSLPKLGIAALMFLGAVGIAVKSCHSSSPPIETGLYTALGRALALETAEGPGSEGSVVLLIPDASFKMPPVAAMVSGFKKALPRSIDIVAEEKVFMATAGPLSGLLTPELYADIAARYPDAGTLVSFVGLGEFGNGDFTKAGAAHLPVHLVSVNAPVPMGYFKVGLVRVAVEPRLTSDPVSPPWLARRPVDSVERPFEAVVSALEPRDVRIER